MFLFLVAGLLFADAAAKPELTPQASGNKTPIYFLYENNNGNYEGRIGLFDSQNYSVEKIAKFNTNYYLGYEIATTQNKIFGIDSTDESFEIYDLSTRQISKGPAPPEWRIGASVAYYKNKVYNLGGEDPKTRKNTNRVDVLIDGKWQTGPAFPRPISGYAQTITFDGILYVIDNGESGKIYRLSDDEREWIEIGESEERFDSAIATLNGKIYITGGRNKGVFKSCLCFDPSAPVGSRISQIADMNYARHKHSPIAANGKLYAIGGFQDAYETFCNSIEEYDPQTNEWRIVGKFA